MNHQPPSTRWFDLLPPDGEIFVPPVEGYELAQKRRGEQHHQLINQAQDLCRDIGSPADLVRLIAKISDAADDLAFETSRQSYDIGYGDGWHAGAMSILRLVAATNGIAVPQPSEAMSSVLGLARAGQRPVAADSEKVIKAIDEAVPAGSEADSIATR